MGKAGGRLRSRLRMSAVGALAATLAACASGPSPQVYDLAAAQPPPARPLRAQISVSQPVATLDLDSDSVLVRTSPMTLATLPGARWPQSLTSLFRARLIASFHNAGLARYLAGRDFRCQPSCAGHRRPECCRRLGQGVRGGDDENCRVRRPVDIRTPAPDAPAAMMREAALS